MYIPCTYMYMMYLGSDEVTNNKGKSQHEHFHVVTSHLCTLLAINVKRACTVRAQKA